MKMKDFYLPFLSDSSLNMFPDNKQSEFTVRLDYPIHIESKMKDGKYVLVPADKAANNVVVV